MRRPSGPNDLVARKLLASLRLQTGKTEEAVEMLEAIVKDAPDLVDVHVQLATAYARLKRKDDADRERAIIDRLNAEIAGEAARREAARQGRRRRAVTSGHAAPVSRAQLRVSRNRPTRHRQADKADASRRRWRVASATDEREVREFDRAREGGDRGAAGRALGRSHRSLRQGSSS